MLPLLTACAWITQTPVLPIPGTESTDTGLDLSRRWNFDSAGLLDASLTEKAAFGDSDDVWNGDGPYGGSDYTLTGMVRADGSASEVQVQVLDLPGRWSMDVPPVPSQMFTSYAYAPGFWKASLTIRGLPPDTYDFVFYSHLDGENDWSGFSVRVDDVDGLAVFSSGERRTDGASYLAPQWTEGSHYVKHRKIAVGAGQSVTVTITPGLNSSSPVVLNGWQIIGVDP